MQQEQEQVVLVQKGIRCPTCRKLLVIVLDPYYALSIKCSRCGNVSVHEYKDTGS